MDWIVTVVKATHKICSGRSGSPSATLKMLAPRKEMMKPNMHPNSNRMYRVRLSYSPRPSSTALMIVEKLSSVTIITAACYRDDIAGTSCPAGISACWPSRRTLAVMIIIFCSAVTAASALPS